MNLSRSAFEQGWAMLATRFNAPKAAKDGYWAFLSPRLDDASFRHACEHLFATSHRFPRPADFVEDVPGEAGVGWAGFRTWVCEECGELGRSLGTPEFHVCVACVRHIGRLRLRELRKEGKPVRALGGAMEVGYELLRADKA